eukprot:1331360-Rhodomonas_salina.7
MHNVPDVVPYWVRSYQSIILVLTTLVVQIAIWREQANSRAPQRSAFKEDCICNAGFSGADGGPCPACVEGTYKPAPGPQKCTQVRSAISAYAVATRCPVMTERMAVRKRHILQSHGADRQLNMSRLLHQYLPRPAGRRQRQPVSLVLDISGVCIACPANTFSASASTVRPTSRSFDARLSSHARQPRHRGSAAEALSVLTGCALIGADPVYVVCDGR